MFLTNEINGISKERNSVCVCVSLSLSLKSTHLSISFCSLFLKNRSVFDCHSLNSNSSLYYYLFFPLSLSMEDDQWHDPLLITDVSWQQDHNSNFHCKFITHSPNSTYIPCGFYSLFDDISLGRPFIYVAQLNNIDNGRLTPR